MKQLVLVLTIVLSAFSLNAATLNYDELPTANDISSYTDLTPELNFNSYENMPMCISGTAGWNATTNWRDKHDEYNNFPDGALAFCFPGAANNAALMSSGVSKLDLGGSCGKVLVINTMNSTFEDAVRTYFNAPSMTVGKSETASPNVFCFFPRYPEGEGWGRAPLTVRFVFSIYSESDVDVFKVKATGNGMDRCSYSDFINTATFKTDGQWDPTKWIALDLVCHTEPEFPTFIHAEGVTGNNITYLIRSITFFRDGTETVTNKCGAPKPFMAVRHSVYAKNVEIAVPEEDRDLLEQAELRDDQVIRFTAPENHELWVKIEHDQDRCDASAHAAMTLSSESAESDADGYTKAVIENGVYTYHAPAAGHAEKLSIKAKNLETGFTTKPVTYNFKSNIVSGIEEVGFEEGDAPAELYNLQGVKVDAATAAPGIYIERRGTAARKVVK